ncbi:MAG: glycosyltransferase [Candidatus Kapabacteria bacterium]|nr:glycosyltransferase [Candidatus Kapabacteria bacterium]
MFQRPPQLAKALSKKNCLVFYNYKFPTKNFFTGFYEVLANCYITFRLDLVLELERKKIFYTVSYDTSTSFDFVSKLIDKGNIVIYDYLDEIHPDINQIEIDINKIEKHNKILKDERFIVLATAEKLYGEVEKFRQNKKYLIPNAADLEHFSQKRNIQFTSEFTFILNKNKPIIGYYGTIAKWIDFELLIYLAKQRKEYEFVMIGLIGDNSIYDYDFSQIKNLTFHQPVNYQDLPSYANKFDICIIPFRKYSVTEATSPIKLFEYMAMSKPIVSTDLTECKKYESVLIAESFEEFAEMVDYGLKLKSDDIYFKKMKNEAKENSWNMRAERILEIISGEI